MSEAVTSRRLIDPLTGIRGFAAIWVVLYHLRPTIRVTYPSLTPLHNFVDAGYLGVDLFAFLSGFIITYTYSVKLAEYNMRAAGRYLWLRLVRTYPLHLFVLFLFILLFINERGLGSLAVLPYDMSFIRQLFLLNGLGFETHWAWNVPSWSLSAEWFCYLCFPLLVPLIDRVRDGRMALLFAAVAIILTAVLLAQVGRPRFDAFLDWGLLRIGGEFLSGCFLCRAYYAGTCSGRYIGMIGLSAIAFFIVQLAFYPEFPVVLVIAAFAVLIYSLAHSRQPLLFLFGNPVSMYLGKISYSIYLVHWLYLADLTVFGFNNLPVSVRVWVVLGVVLVTSSITYHFVERASSRYLRDLLLAEARDAGYSRSS